MRTPARNHTMKTLGGKAIGNTDELQLPNVYSIYSLLYSSFKSQLALLGDNSPEGIILTLPLIMPYAYHYFIPIIYILGSYSESVWLSMWLIFPSKRPPF